MSRKERRVRVITDPEKYRRHQRQKLLQKLLKVGIYVLVLVVAIATVWIVLEMFFRPRPLD